MQREYKIRRSPWERRRTSQAWPTSLVWKRRAATNRWSTPHHLLRRIRLNWNLIVVVAMWKKSWHQGDAINDIDRRQILMTMMIPTKTRTRGFAKLDISTITINRLFSETRQRTKEQYDEVVPTNELFYKAAKAETSFVAINSITNRYRIQSLNYRRLSISTKDISQLQKAI